MLLTEEIIALWIKWKQSYVKESTLAQYRRTVYNILVEEYKLYDLSDFSTDKQREFVDTLIKRYSIKTVRNIIAVLNQLFDFAAERKLIISEIKLTVKVSTAKYTKIKVLNSYEQRTFTRYLINNLDFSKLGILICLYTGMRLGEICGLQWKDFDFNCNTIKIRKTVQRISTGKGATYFLVSSPKTQCSEREIPIPTFLIKYFTMNNHNISENAYVATGTEEFVQPRTYQNRLKSYFKQCNLPLYHFHTLRHTFASRAVEFGFDIKALSEVLGHSSTKITLDLYVHPSMELKHQEMQKLSAIMK